MGNHQLALQEIEKFTKVFKAFEEAKNAIIALASLDQNVKELEAKKINIITSLEYETEQLESFRKLAIAEKERLRLSQEKKEAALENNFKIKQEALEQAFLGFKLQIDTETSKITTDRDLVSSDLSKLKTKIYEATTELNKLENRIIDVRKQIALMLKE